MSWKTVALGDICSIVNGGTPKSEVAEYWDGDLNWITPKEMGKLISREISSTERKITDKGMKNSSAKLLPINSVILSSRAPIGHLAINKSLMATNQGCKGLVPSEALNYEYLYYFLSHSKQLLNDMGSGATFKELSGSKLATVEIPLPPLSIQQKIVSKIDAIFAEIDKATAAAVANAKNAEALFQSFLSRSLIHNPECISYKLSEICDIARGGSPRPIDKFITEDIDGINWVKIGDATRSKKYIYETKERIIREGISRSRLVNDGDFILSNSMSFGRPYIMRTSGCIHDGWLVLSNYKKHLDIDFFFYLLSSTIVKNQFERLAQGSTVRNLNKELVGKVEVSIPPLEKQKHMVKMLDLVSNSFDKAREAYGRKISELELLRVSILKKGFAGELVKE